MSIIKAKEYLKSVGYEDRVIEFAESTATVAEAAEAVGVEPAMIAKTMSFLGGRQSNIDPCGGNCPGRQSKIQRYISYKSKDDSI